MTSPLKGVNCQIRATSHYDDNGNVVETHYSWNGPTDGIAAISKEMMDIIQSGVRVGITVQLGELRLAVFAYSELADIWYVRQVL